MKVILASFKLFFGRTKKIELSSIFINSSFWNDEALKVENFNELSNKGAFFLFENEYFAKGL